MKKIVVLLLLLAALALMLVTYMRLAHGDATCPEINYADGGVVWTDQNDMDGWADGQYFMPESGISIPVFLDHYRRLRQ